VKLRVNRTETRAPWERRQRNGWTILEILGAFAIIGFLAAMLIPTITELIERAKINNLIMSYKSLRTAAVNHAKQYQLLNSLFGNSPQSLPISNYVTTILLPEGFLDHPFTPPIGGTNPIVHLVSGPASNNGWGYWFAGLGDGTNAACSTNFSYVLECILTNVPYLDAGSASLILDQAQFVPALDGFLDTAGKMDYSTNNGGTLRMYIVGQ
jgi:type II secretory pathway pseudopilin PulG